MVTVETTESLTDIVEAETNSQTEVQRRLSWKEGEWGQLKDTVTRGPERHWPVLIPLLTQRLFSGLYFRRWRCNSQMCKLGFLFPPINLYWSSLYETDCPFFTTPLTTHISPPKSLTSKQSHQRQKSLLPGTRTVYLAVGWTIQQAEWLQCFTSHAGLWNLTPPLGQTESSYLLRHLG